MHTTKPRQFVCIDAGVEDRQSLLSGISDDAVIHILSDASDGLQQVASLLAHEQNIAALHIISHGAPGKLFLGNSTLNSANLSRHNTSLKTIVKAMSAAGELFLYGCEVAAGERGASFVKMLGDITGLKVAAATHKVGHAELGGSWELDMSAAQMNNALTVSEWRGVLVDTTAPRLTNISWTGTTVTLTYDETLSTENVPAFDMYTVKVNGSAVSLAAGTPVAIDGSSVILTLDAALTGSEKVSVSYQDPTMNGTWIKDASGDNNFADFFSDLSVAPLGGVSVEGNLKVSVLPDGTMVIDRYDGTAWNTQFYDNEPENMESQEVIQANNIYGSVSSGNIIEINGKTIGLGNYACDSSNTRDSDYVPLSNIAISKSGNTITTTWTLDQSVHFWNNSDSMILSGSVVVTQKVTLSSDSSQSVNVEWDITNNTGSELTNVRFARVVDSYLAGGDNGAGLWIPSQNTVGVEKLTSTGIQQMLLQSTGEIDPVDVQSGDYALVLDAAAAADGVGLQSVDDSNTELDIEGINTDPTTDNGYAMEWIIPSLANNATTTIAATESFVASTVLTQQTDTTTPTEAVGEAITLTFEVTNVSGIEKSATYAVEVPTGWSAAVLSVTSSTLAATDNVDTVDVDETKATVTIQVTPAAGTTAGDYAVALKTTVDGTTTQSIGTVSVAAPADTTDPVVTSTPVTTVDEGAQYNYTLSATDEHNVTWSVKDGTTLPDWLTLGKGDAAVTIADDFTDPGGMAYDDTTNTIYAVYNSYIGGMLTGEMPQTAIYKIAEDGTKTPFTNTEFGQVGSMAIYDGYLYAGFVHDLNIGAGSNLLMRYSLSDMDGSVTPEVLLQYGDSNANTYYDGGIFTGLIEKDGFLYAVDYTNSKILKFDLSNISAAPETYLDLSATAPDPYGIAFDSDGNLYGTSFGNMQNQGEIPPSVFKYDGTDVSFVMSTPGAGVGAEVLHGVPTDIKIDADGNFYISHLMMFDGVSGIYKYDSSFVEQESISTTANTWSMLFNSEGKIIAGDVKIDMANSTVSGDIFGIDTANYSLTGTAPSVDANTPTEITLIATDEAGNETEHTFTLTVSDVPEPSSSFVLDLDQVGEGSEATNNSTGLVDFDAGAYFADSETVLGDTAPAEYQKLVISYDSTGWDDAIELNLGVYNPLAYDGDGDGSTSRLTRSDAYTYTFYASEYGGSVDLLLTYSGTWGSSPQTITITNDSGGILTKEDLNILLKNMYIGDRYDSFSETREFGISATDDAGNVSEISTFSVSWKPDTTGPEVDFVEFEAGVLSLYFNELPVVNTGDIKIYNANDELVATIPVDSDDVEVDPDENAIYITFQDALTSGASYYVKIDAGALKDEIGNLSAAVTDPQAIDFSIPPEPLWEPDAAKSPIAASEQNVTGDYLAFPMHGDLQYVGETPYVLFKELNQADWTNSLVLKKFANGAWTTVGGEAITTGIDSDSFDYQFIDGKPYVFVSRSIDGLTSAQQVYSLNDAGNAWVQVGSDLATQDATKTSWLSLEKSGSTLYAAMGLHNGNDTFTINIYSLDTAASTPTWTSLGSTPGNAINSQDGSGFELIVQNGEPWLVTVTPNGINNNPQINLLSYEEGQGWGVADPKFASLIDTNYYLSAGRVLAAKVNDDKLYVAYSNGINIDVVSIDLNAESPTLVPLADAGNFLSMGQFFVSGNDSRYTARDFDLNFDPVDGAPVVTLISEGWNESFINWKWDADSSAWTKLDPASIDLSAYQNSHYDLEYGPDGKPVMVVTSFETGQLEFLAFNPEESGSGSDTTAPAYQSASISGSTLTLVYDEALKSDGLPATSVFTLKVNGNAVSNGISSVAINGSDNKKLDLTLANQVFFGQTVTISYNDPTTDNDPNAIQDAAGNDAVSLVDYGVSNATAATSSVTIGSQMQGRSVNLSVGGGYSINQATNSAAPTTLGKSIKMPLGQFAFDITGVQNGGTAQLSMTADADLKQLTYYKYNYLTQKWTNIAKNVVVDQQNNKATVFFDLTDGGAYDADRTVNGTIVDPGGVAENKLLPVIYENETSVGFISALNADLLDGNLSYAITGGADADKFSIDSNTGELSFNAAPDYENPTDLGDTAANNTYAVNVTATGSNGGSELQPLIITVMNMFEDGDPTVGSSVISDEGSITLDPEDKDGVSAGDESAVQRGSFGVGDGNGDGVADNEQTAVTSVPFRKTDQISQNPTADVAYITLVADSLNGAIDTTDNNSARITSIAQQDAPSDLPTGLDMPLGLVSFTADIQTAGLTETFSLFIDSSLSVNGYWKQNTDGVWCNIATDIVSLGNGTARIDFAITDGGEFDEDGRANGTIVDPGAVGSMPLSSVSATPDRVGGATGGFWF